MSLFTELKACLLVAAKNDVRYYFRGIKVDQNSLTATDGSLMIIIDHNIEIHSEDFHEFIICRDDLTSKLKMFNKKSPLKLSYVNGEAFLNEYKLKLIEGRYPNTKRVIVNTFSDDSLSQNSAIGINPHYLSTLTKAIATAIDKKQMVAAKMTMYDKGISFEKDNVNAYIMAARL